MWGGGGCGAKFKFWLQGPQWVLSKAVSLWIIQEAVPVSAQVSGFIFLEDAFKCNIEQFFWYVYTCLLHLNVHIFAYGKPIRSWPV